MNKEINRYLDHLELQARVSPTTLRNYTSTLKHFAQWAGERALSTDVVAQYLQQFPHPATANVKAVRLAGLARFLKVEIETQRAKEAYRMVEALTSSEVRDLVFQADLVIKPIITLLAETGLRLAEFRTLTKDSVVARSGCAGLIVVGKGSKQRWVPLSEQAQYAMNRIDFQMEETLLRKGLARAGKKAGLRQHIHPHLLRASCISILLNERKREAIQVAVMVGHSNLNTMLKHYYKPTAEAMRELVA